MVTETLAVGDVVYLNSGSPALTVVNVTSDEVRVAWMDETGDVWQAKFPRACVHK